MSFWVARAAGLAQNFGSRSGKAGPPNIARFARCVASAVLLAFALSPSFALAEESKVTLLSSGSGKKTKLRFRPKAGMVQTIVMTSGQQMAMKIGDTNLPQQPLPKTVVTMELKVLSVDKNGHITASFGNKSVDVLATPGVAPQMAEQMKTAMQPMTSIKGRMTVDPRGNVLAADITSSAEVPPMLRGMLDNMRENLNQMVVPLPEQAVGAGAKWKVVQNLSKMGMPMTQEATITLVRRKGNVVVLKSDLVQNVREGKVTLPNMPPGIQATTKPSQSKGSGQMEVDLTKIGAVGNINIDINVSMVMQMQGQTQAMDMAMKMDLNMKEK